MSTTNQHGLSSEKRIRRFCFVCGLSFIYIYWEILNKEMFNAATYEIINVKYKGNKQSSKILQAHKAIF